MYIYYLLELLMIHTYYYYYLGSFQVLMDVLLMAHGLFTWSEENLTHFYTPELANRESKTRIEPID